MLDSETRRRIDNARDILVGKVPDPKTQVEQITFALIYKFMDDMDQQSVSLGGKATFFANGYEQYAWSKLMDRKLGGAARMDLYVRALEGMSTNPHIPQLFRDIFKGAFMPYRDAETLNLFLKEMNAFTYAHSEDLGDAYEYLLSIFASQGKAGQFRTPRHIIDFIVDCVNPGKNDTMLDPACGTAGFLISAYKHIIDQNSATPLTGEEKKRLTGNFAGYDISPDMVRLSRVNMYLHQFPNPTIHEYDTLTYEDRWDENYDVILANPPFMTPKGGIRPHTRFAVQANRSEVLFVDYIAEHLNPGGRAGVIVPEGIIFQSANAYKALRRMLVDGNYLVAVISLPAGIFNPYSGVKTSILLLDKDLAKRTDKVLFVKVEADGYDLGAQRREIERNDLPEALKMVKAFQEDPTVETLNPLMAQAISKQRLGEDGDYNLSGERYKESIQGYYSWPLVKLGDTSLFNIESGGTPSTDIAKYWEGNINWATLVDLPSDNLITHIHETKRKITEVGLVNSSAKMIPPGSVIVSSRATIGRIAINDVELATNQGFKNIIIQDKAKVNEKYLALMLTRLVDKMKDMGTGGTYKEISKSSMATLEIPLPPLEVQQEIVDEIDGYQKIIDGARQVVENYKPVIKIDPSWPLVQLGEVCEVFNGSTPSRSEPAYWENGDIPWFTVDDIRENGRQVNKTKQHVTEKALAKTSLKLLPINTVLICCTASVGEHAITKIPMASNQQFNGLVVKDIYQDKFYPEFLFHLAANFKEQLMRLGGTTAFKFISSKDLKTIIIPFPPIDDQRSIVERLNLESDIINANKTLITIFEQKVEEKIQEVWGEDYLKVDL